MNEEGTDDLRGRLRQADAVFMSPPWGGPAYSAKTFDVSRDIGGLGVNLAQLLAVAASLLRPGQPRTLPGSALPYTLYQRLC